MRIFLAPMEGVVDHHLRKIYSLIGGVDICVTEFIRVTDTRLPEKVFKKSCPELLSPIATPVRVQLLGSNPKTLAYNAAKAARLGAPAVDLNFGCPAKTVNRNRGGACLLEEPDLIYSIVKAVREAVPQSTPVTAKIRLGYNARSGYLETAKAISCAGANELIVHARSKEDGYNPPAYWAHIAEIKQHVNIPVIANGEIWTVRDYLRCKEESGCEDIMLGRGLLAKPDLALAIKAQQQSENYEDTPWEDITPILHQFHSETLSYYPAKYCGNRLKQWLMYLKRQYPQANTFFENIKKVRDAETIEAYFQNMLNNN